MPAEHVTVEGETREYVTEEIVECPGCGFRWMRQYPPPDGEEVCPDCEDTAEWRVVGEEIRGRRPGEVWDFGDAESIDALAALFERRAAELRALRERGWRLREEVAVGLEEVPGRPRQLSPFLSRERE